MKRLGRALLIFTILLSGFSLSSVNTQAGEFLPSYLQRANIDGRVSFKWDSITISTVNGDDLHFDVEMATTFPQWQQGLMYRTELSDHHGMLFVFDDVAMRSFWMKNTLIPLDMLFIAEDGRIHHIHHNAIPQDRTGITSKYSSKAVLELRGGAARDFGIQVGDKVKHASFMNVGIQE
ncbi:MAG: hypothetical protein CBB87_10325 [Micavibrio sp. TMED27]|nr:hypothetical protein [Micavibrio sp.]OUT90152.1 MAG: hypothetical protein CBB87_10325 [Micavibrio sp. TMED27]|tara:strand:- start:2838 stop:3371 length:534 start_codon:yes stop_codon:yes gene_type:complete